MSLGRDSDDEKQITATGVKDPADSIGYAIVERLATRFSLSIIEAGAGSADLILEIGTSHWGIAPTRLDHYAVKYQGALRLIDNRRNVIVADGLCSTFVVDNEDIPTYDELLKDNAVRLKNELKVAAEYCIQDYRTRILGLY